jgi:hypothetical protein
MSAVIARPANHSLTSLADIATTPAANNEATTEDLYGLCRRGRLRPRGGPKLNLRVRRSGIRRSGIRRSGIRRNSSGRSQRDRKDFWRSPLPKFLALTNH